jgi:hypothetical protein
MPTGTTVHVLDVDNGHGITFRVVLLPDGQSVNYPAASEITRRPLVEFYDTRFPQTPDGQFVSRYYLDTLLTGRQTGLNLQGDVPAWSIDDAGMTVVRRWLRQYV